MSDSKNHPDSYQPSKDLPVTDQSFPGRETKLPAAAHHATIPDATTAKGYQHYKAAGKLEGKNAVITGGDSGIGRSTAILFALEGADVLITYLPDEKEDAEETKKEISERAKDRKVYLHEVDFSTNPRDACKTIVEAATTSFASKKVDILFNNAAFQMMKQDIADLPDEQWLHTFNVNIHPMFFLTKYLLPHMNKHASIINNASINAYVGRPDLLDYTSTKGAIVSLTRGLSNMLLVDEKRRIRVNALAPGPVWTPLIPATMDEGAQESFTSPMGRPAQPSEIATCVVFLASTDSSAISGQTIHCNGGTIVNG